MLNTQDYKAQILDKTARRFEANHNSLADAHALISAIDVYASLVWFETGRVGKETAFKNVIEQQCEAFGIIRSASNAIKHIERTSNNVVVKSMRDIQAGSSGGSFHRFLANGGNSGPSVAITMNWEHDSNTNVYKYKNKDDNDNDKIIDEPQNTWKTQYLQRLYPPAIEAIEAKLTELQ